jgi:hypothetical protein
MGYLIACLNPKVDVASIALLFVVNPFHKVAMIYSLPGFSCGRDPPLYLLGKPRSGSSIPPHGGTKCGKQKGEEAFRTCQAGLGSTVL